MVGVCFCFVVEGVFVECFELCVGCGFCCVWFVFFV